MSPLTRDSDPIRNIAPDELREQIAALVRDAQQAAGTWGASGRTALRALTEAVDAIEQLVEAQVAQWASKS